MKLDSNRIARDLHLYKMGDIYIAYMCSTVSAVLGQKPYILLKREKGDIFTHFNVFQ